jgi:hypothetical protein
MFTMLSLVISMSLLYMITSGIKTSGAMKRYRSTVEAAYGGVDIMIKDIINSNLLNASSMTPAEFTTQMTNYVAGFTAANGFNSKSINAACLQEKLTKPSKQWSTACKDFSLTPNATNSDISFQLKATTGLPYNVYAKIVDTMEYVFEDFVDGKKVITKSAGNTDLSSTQLEGAAVVQSGGGNSNPSQPYMYRIEILAGRPASSMEKSQISVQYLY